MSNLKLPTMTHANLRKLLGKRPSIKLAYATEAHAEHGSDRISVTQHDNVIAVLTGDTLYVDNCGYDSATTANRLRKILHDNGLDYYVRIRDFGMRLYNGAHTEIDSEFRRAEFTRLGNVWAMNYAKLS